MSRQPLSTTAIAEALNSLPGWKYDQARLVKDFCFAGFPEALAFLVRLGIEAEVANHHPEITNVYNRVTIALTTHDAGNQVTQKDVALASAIERIVGGTE